MYYTSTKSSHAGSVIRQFTQLVNTVYAVKFFPRYFCNASRLWHKMLNGDYNRSFWSVFYPPVRCIHMHLTQLSRLYSHIFILDHICPHWCSRSWFIEFIFSDSCSPRGRLRASGMPPQVPSSLATTLPTSWPGVATLVWRRPICLSPRASVRAAADHL